MSGKEEGFKGIKKSFTFEQHQELGVELYEISQRLIFLGNKLHGSYNRKTAEFAFEAHENVIKLRAEMDNHIYRETDDDSGVYFKTKYLTNSK